MNKRSYTLELYQTIVSLPEMQRRDYLSAFVEREKNPVVSFGLNAFLGYFGIDRFYLGQPLLGLLKLITLGGFGIWVVVDYFLIASTTREMNMAIAREIKASMQTVA